MDNVEEVFLKNMNLVPYMIGRMELVLPVGMDMEDVMAYGYAGLLEAIIIFREDESNFSSFVCPRIRGAVIDGVRAYQALNKSQARDAARFMNARNKLQEQRKSLVAHEDVADYLGISVKQGRDCERLANVLLMSRNERNDRRLERCGSEISAYDVILERFDLMRALNSLSEEERRVIEWKFFQNRSLRELEKNADIGRIRIRNLYESALGKLREYFLQT